MGRLTGNARRRWPGVLRTLAVAAFGGLLGAILVNAVLGWVAPHASIDSALLLVLLGWLAGAAAGVYLSRRQAGRR